jgi:hypothetical protein
MHPIARTVRSQQPTRTMAATLARLKSAIESQSARFLPACRGSTRLQPSPRPGSGRYWLLQEKGRPGRARCPGRPSPSWLMYSWRSQTAMLVRLPPCSQQRAEADDLRAATHRADAVLSRADSAGRRRNYQVVGPKLMTMRNGMHDRPPDMTTGSLSRRSNRERRRR